MKEPEGLRKTGKAANRLPSAKFLNEAFLYDQESGSLFWAERPVAHFKGGNGRTPKTSAEWWNKRYAGKEITTNNHGYRRVNIYKQGFYVHRLVWKMSFGTEPAVIDHINGNPSDNRLSNLRDVTQETNTRNCSYAKGVGVYEERKGFGWYAQIPIEGKVKSKLFKNRDDAIAWREASVLKLGFSKRHLGMEP